MTKRARRILWWSVVGVFALIGVLVVAFVVTGGSYAFVMYQSALCSPPRSRHRAEVERCLSFYRIRACEAQPVAAFGITLGPSDNCVSYEILGVEPIYVTYDRNGAVLAWYEVYE